MNKCHKIQTKDLRSFSIFYSLSVFENFYYSENKFRELQVKHETRKIHISKFVEWPKWANFKWIFEFLLNTICLLFKVEVWSLYVYVLCLVSVVDIDSCRSSRNNETKQSAVRRREMMSILLLSTKTLHTNLKNYCYAKHKLHLHVYSLYVVCIPYPYQ